MGIVPELLAHSILLGFAAYVIVSANPGSSLFSWHPTCMVLAVSIFLQLNQVKIINSLFIIY
jgi:hypothetical protein